jgi:microcin C transport system ATP-binding protein
MSVLEVKGLSLAFGESQVVRDVSFSVARGQMLAVVGESGSGKSLTALSCLGLQPQGAALSGSIRFDGQELVGLPEVALRTLRGRRISMVFQEPMTALNPLHTIGKQIGEALSVHGRDASTARIMELLEKVGLGDFRERLGAYPHQLSGGQRQRVMIAMAIANEPDLLIADEPTTAVDVTVQAKILKLLKELQHSLGMAILFITHDLTIVQRMADRVAVMHEGKLVEQGETTALFASPQHPYTRHLLASQPKGVGAPVPADAEELVSCDGLKVWFPNKKGFWGKVSSYTKAVDILSISIPKSSTLGLVGESGSGKSTLGFALLRLIKSEGTIVFMGQPIHLWKTGQLQALRQQMQVVFQDPFSSLSPRMSVAQIIGEGLEVHFPQLSEEQRQQRVDAILSEVGLDPAVKERFPHEFSGGQRQRISIARAMVLEPKFVVLDEPTSALDLSMQSQILDLLKKLQAKTGVSYLFISHDLRVVAAIAQRLIVMKDGKVVEAGNTADIFAAPQQDYTRTLIKAAFIND